MIAFRLHPSFCLAFILTGATTTTRAVDLDPNFGAGGTALQLRSSGPSTGFVHTGGIARTPDGGYWWSMDDGSGALLLGRITEAGVPDTGFGSGTGRVRIDQCVANGASAVLAEDNESVILWTGRCLTRRRFDGTLDPLFGTGGSTDVATLVKARLARDAQGRIVVAGAEANQWRAYRFLANGTLDPAFGIDGRATPTIPSTNGLSALEAVAIRSDGSMVLGGSRGNTQGPNIVLFGLTNAGASDPQFGNLGLLDMQVTQSGAYSRAQSLIATANGDVWVSGEYSTGSVACCLLATRITRLGQVDPTVGIRTYALGTDDLVPFFEMRSGIGVAGDGVWVARNSFPLAIGHRTQFTLIRLKSDGSLDTSFAQRGWRSWFVDHPVTHQASGDYIQLHDNDFSESTITLFGRTFFEDDGDASDYITTMRVRLDGIFASSFESL